MGGGIEIQVYYSDAISEKIASLYFIKIASKQRAEIHVGHS